MADVILLLTGIFVHHFQVPLIFLVQLHDVLLVALEGFLKSADYSQILLNQFSFVVVFPDELIYLIVHALIFLYYLLRLGLYFACLLVVYF